MLGKHFIMDYFIETPQQTEIADYSAYLQLKQLKFTNKHIAKHLGYSNDKFGRLLSSYTFINKLEYCIQEQEGDYHFNGEFYVTKNVQKSLTTEEILEIYTFVQELVEQHKGIYHIQEFKHVRLGRKLYLVDQLDKKHSILMFESEYRSPLSKSNRRLFN